jgi:pyruvate,water dikinase
MRSLFGRAVRATALFAAEREATKAAFMRAIEPSKQSLTTLARRHGIPHDEIVLVLFEELPTLLADPSSMTAVTAERRSRRDFLQARTPPFWFEGQLPPPETWPPRGARDRPDPGSRVLTGMGVCPGVATGAARVVLDPADPRDLGPDDVLIAPITDPAWTPLFLAAAAVVVDVGAQQSHAAIVARELGIPAVVSVTDATRTIPDGARVTVDGSAGTVTVH